MNAAARVCRLCYVKFAEGQSKDEVLSFRDSICRQYDTAPAARCSDEVEDDAPKDHEAHMKVKLHTRTAGLIARTCSDLPRASVLDFPL